MLAKDKLLNPAMIGEANEVPLPVQTPFVSFNIETPYLMQQHLVLDHDC